MSGLRVLTAMLILSASAESAQVGTTIDEHKLIDAITNRPWPGDSFPVLPTISTPMRSRMVEEFRSSPEIRSAIEKLDAKNRRNVDWFEAVRILEEQQAVWSLQGCLCHPHEDVQIQALRSLERLQDAECVPFLLIYAEYMAVYEDGSENATIHGVIHRTLAKTFSKLTGVVVELNGQDVEGLQRGIQQWRTWMLAESALLPEETIAAEDRPETDAEILQSLQRDFEALLTNDPHAAQMREAERLLQETNSSDRWTNYSAAIQIMRKTRSRASIPLLLKYMVLHAELASAGSDGEYIETINLLTGENHANPYRYVADRVTPMREGVRKLTLEWWRPQRDRITTDLARTAEPQLEKIVDDILKKVRWDNDWHDVPEGGERSAYALYHDLFYDVMQPGRMSAPPELHHRMLPSLLRHAGYRPPGMKEVPEPPRVPLELVPLLATLRNDGHAEELDDIAADEKQFSTTRLTAILSLYAAGEDLQVRTIASILGEERRLHHRLVCILSFVRCNDKELAADVLLPLLSDRNAEIRAAAVYAIRRTRPEGGLAVLTKMLNEPGSREHLSSILDGIAEYETDEAKHTIAAFLEDALAENRLDDVYNTIGPFADVTGERFYEAGAHSREYYVEQARQALVWWKQHLKDEQLARSRAETADRQRIKALFVDQVTQFLESKALREGKPVSRALAALLEDDTRLVVQRQPFTQSADRVSDTLRPIEQEQLILYGSVADLDRDGDCWALESTGTFGISLAGYIDAESDELVFLWVVPEG